MKTPCFLCNKWPAIAGLALVCSAYQGFAQDYVVNAFDNDVETLWTRWWGSAPQTYEFDPTMDADNNPNSGSMKVTVDFDLAAYAGDNQFAAVRAFENSEILDGTKYTSFGFDLHWDANSPQVSGNFGNLEYGLGPTDYSQITLSTFTVPTSASTGWTHVSSPISPTVSKVEALRSVFMKIWSGGNAGLTGQTIFWVDNVKLIANTNVVAPPPSMTIVPKPVTGLQIYASAAGQQYQRQNISTLASDTNGSPNMYSWVGSSAPVTYSMTVKEFPDGAHSGFQGQIFLVPDGVMPYGSKDNSIDWNATHTIWMHLGNDTNGAASCTFRYKTNQPGGNSMLFNSDPANGGVGVLAQVTNDTPVGTWSMTFKNNTEITMTAPGGATTNFALPSDVAALFADPITVYFGFQPNQPGNIGQRAILGGVKIAGTPTPLEDDFAGETLDTSKWQIVAADSTGILPVPKNARFWLKWTIPAVGYSLEASTNLLGGAWFDPGLTNTFQVNGEKMILLSTDNLPDATASFFRMKKP